MVNVVASAPDIATLMPLAESLKGRVPATTSVLLNVNDTKSSVATGSEEHLLLGQDHITERLDGVTFQVSANSFFQTNTAQAERLFALVAEACELDATDTVMDLYSGTGAISLLLARRAAHVYGIEVVAAAVADATRNARANGIDNCTFLAGRGAARAARAHARRCAGLGRRGGPAAGRLPPQGAGRPGRPGAGADRLRLLQPGHPGARRRRSDPAGLPPGLGPAGRHVSADPAHRGRGAPVPGMKTFLLRRLLQSLVVLFGVSFIVFAILFLTGDPALVLLPPDASAEDVRRFREVMGFNDPFLVQYGRFLKGALQGDFGQSVRHGEPAFALVVERLPATFELAGAALLLALGLAIPAGILSAVRRNTPVDYVATVVALFGQSLPTFWLGIMLILVFSVQFHWLPSSGRGTLQHLILPAITLGLFTTARITRLTRSGMLEVLNQDYIRTARAKGVNDPPVVWKHALKNAAIPIVTIVGIELGTLLGGSVITETIFAWPGVGRLSVQAIANRDYPVVQAAVFLLATTFVVVNLLVDIIYTYLDPRIRLR
jgi:peptide/nickel transport system permease protein